jgi:hypothetical protein
VRSGNWEFSPAHDGPPQVTVTATGWPKPQSEYFPWAFVVVVDMDEEVDGRPGLLTGLKFRSPKLGRSLELVVLYYLVIFCVRKFT